MRTTFRTALLTVLAFIFLCGFSRTGAEEGLWLFSEPPRQRLKEKYSFDLSDSWLERLQKSSVEFNSGGSGAMVSPDGLLLTNHHVALHWLQELERRHSNLVQDGLCVGDRAQEIKCPGLEVRAVWEMEDVTARVHRAIKPEMSLAEARQARWRTCQAIEKESQQKTGLESEVECLNQGARYHLFRYRCYDDVRLVFIPPAAVGKIFDVCFVRVYEQGRPVRVRHYLQWADTEPKTGDLVLTAGYPGETHRFLTAAHLKFLNGPPLSLDFKLTGRLERRLARCDNENRAARSERSDLASWRSKMWYLMGQMEDMLPDKRSAEKDFRAALRKDSVQERRYRNAQEQIARSIKEWERLHRNYFFVGRARAFGSGLFNIALLLVRLADETAKPDIDRLPEYSESRLDELKRRLLLAKHMDQEVERVKLAESLAMFVEWAGEKDALAARVLAGKTPEGRATELVTGSRLHLLTVRQKLLEGGNKAIASSKDPMIALARLVDSRVRQIRMEFAEQVIERQRQAYATLGSLGQAAGNKAYPDATGSLRLSYGRVEDADNTYFHVLTMRAFFKYVTSALPTKWTVAKYRIDEKTLVGFATSADGGPGSSGSPVVDRAGRLVGVVHAGSHTPAPSLCYVAGKSQSYAVAASGILAMLDRVYDAQDLVKELVGKRSPDFAASSGGFGEGAAKDVIEINTPKFMMPVHIDRSRNPSIHRMRLFVSEDRGKTWKHHKDYGSKEDTVVCSLPGDGIYWFAVQLELKDGTREPSEVQKLRPLQKILVKSDKRSPEPSPSYSELHREVQELRAAVQALKRRIGELERTKK